MEQLRDELARWELRVADLERRVAEQRRRVACEPGEGFGAREVLHFMEQTLEDWREQSRALRRRRDATSNLSRKGTLSQHLAKS
jgi:hypothetical protein